MKPDIKDCAPKANYSNWNAIDWKKAERSVKSLQRRIAKAIREGKHSKAKSLQWILTHSFHAKLWAVKRVTENKGKRTPGVDKIRWKTPSQKLLAAKSLVRKGYKALPLRRLYILKKNGKKKTVGDSHHERPGFSSFTPSCPRTSFRDTGRQRLIRLPIT